MEDRIADNRAEPTGFGLTALAAIVVITVAWWALALWPAGAVEPLWLARTRAACFGSVPGGLPDAGGWILLIGEPLGLIAMLVVGWRRALRRDFRWLAAHPAAALTAVVAAVIALGTIGTLAVKATYLRAALRAVPPEIGGALQRMDQAAPSVVLIDQFGRTVSLADFRGKTTLLTFAYGHCLTVCPTIVHELQAERRRLNRANVSLVVVTTDPWRDTPDRLPTIAAHWGLGSDDLVLSGDVRDVERALDALGVGRRRNDRTGDVEHASTAMILDVNGRITWRADGSPGRLTTLLR